MKPLEWRRGDDGLQPDWRWYRAQRNETRLTLSRDGDADTWSLSVDFGRNDTILVDLPGGDLPDAEAQALALPTLVRALRQVLAELEGE